MPARKPKASWTSYMARNLSRKNSPSSAHRTHILLYFVQFLLPKSMSRDVFESILENLSPTDRFSLAKVDNKVFEATRKWADMDSILLQNNRIVVGNEGSKHIVKVEDTNFSGVLPDVLELCPSVRRWYLEQTLTPPTIDWISKYPKKIQKLYMSAENFDTRVPLDLSKLVLSRCQALYILQAKHQIQYNFNFRIPDNLIQNFFPASLRRVCLTGVFVSAHLLSHLANLPKLASLDLMGSLVNTEDSKKFIIQLENNFALEELSLAPSMFSFAAKSDNMDLGYTFRNLHVAKLSIYMAYFDENWFEFQLKEWFSKELRTLVLYGNFQNILMKPSLLKQRFTILMEARKMVVASKGLVGASCLLASHLVLGPPYVENSSHTVTESWKFDFEAAKRNIETRNAAMAEQQARRAVNRRQRHGGFHPIGRRRQNVIEVEVEGEDDRAILRNVMGLAPVAVTPPVQAAPAVPAVAPLVVPLNPGGNGSTAESVSTVSTTSSRSFVTTPFPSNSSASNESVNRTNANTTSMDIVSSINSPQIREVSAQEAATAPILNTAAPIITEPVEPPLGQPGQSDLPGIPVIAIEPLATSTPLMTSQREINTNQNTQPLDANVIVLNQHAPNETHQGAVGGANGTIGPISEEDVVTANQMEDAFEDLLMATMMSIMEEIQVNQDENDDENGENGMEFDIVEHPLNDPSPTVSPIEGRRSEGTGTDDLHTAIEPIQETSRPASATILVSSMAAAGQNANTAPTSTAAVPSAASTTQK